eukprot:scaffold47755_cov33-Attheya_sp.AAC.1
MRKVVSTSRLAYDENLSSSSSVGYSERDEQWREKRTTTTGPDTTMRNDTPTHVLSNVTGHHM